MMHIARRKILLLSACTAAMMATAHMALAADPIKVGFPGTLTGASSSQDVPPLNGAKLAASEINTAGGVLGRPLELVVYDTKSDPATISTVASQLIDSDKVAAMIGFTDSDSVLALGPQIQKAGIPFVTPGATSPKLPSQVGDTVFLAAFGDNVQAAVGAGFASKALKAKTAFQLTDSATEYTTLLAGYFKAAFEHGGGAIVGQDVYKSGDKSFTAQITKIKAMSPRPDVVYCAAMPDEIGIIVKQMRQAGVTLPVLGGDGYDTPLLLQVAGKAADDVYFTTHAYIGDADRAPVAAFAAAYKKATGNEPENAFAALGYDSVKLLADAIRRAGSAEPGKIREALATTSKLVGVTGTISYRPGIRVPDKSVTVIGVKDGKLMLAAETAPSSVPDP